MQPFVPQYLNQNINPWTFYLQGAQVGLVNINLGTTPAPAVEQRVLDEVGSYGRQLGRIGDVLAVLLRHVALDGMTDAERDAVAILQGQLAQIRAIKDHVDR